ncbi:MAG TPA: efflux RND transporter periplasmic adaptor subunit [Nitrospirae bacterium]|nr:efflux RND transporter periplasmic adaptor subunit [Nitrospirota bacterium]HDL20230.1 efflux RND transporter periplasmic adaptor subunit [Nitrospirota bacterium]HDZ01166.1 efflux RND transporter periplasmic adaptor subunit [Nitrospirota bacterium]
MHITPGSKRDKLFRRIWGMLPSLFLILLIVIIAALFADIKSESERIKAEKLASLHKERPPVNVVVLDMTPLPIRDRLDLPAQVEPWVELKVLAEVPGKVLRLPASEGDHVGKGDLIALLDTRDYENNLASVRAEYGLAQINLSRAKNLFRENLITKARLDDNNVSVETLGAALRNAELRLERCSIKSPIAGIINRLDAKEGLYLNVQDPVAVILDISRVKVSVGIPESDVDDIRRLRDFEIIISALDDRTVKGRKYFLSRSPESLAHLYKLEIEVMNPGGEILPGMFARVDIVKREVKNSMSVPLYSVITRGNGQFVFIEKAGKARARMVETGIIEGWRIQVTKGLARGDHVIVVGHRSVDEGQEVNVVRSVSNPEGLFK